MKAFFTALIMFWAMITIGQSQNQNYLMDLTARDTTSGGLFDLREDQTKVQTNITYFDGLGRKKQAVQREATPDLKDLVTPFFYDAYGRMDKDALPYKSTSSSGSYRGNWYQEHINYYINTQSGGQVANVNYPYSKRTYEASPLQRIIETSAPGNSWRPSQFGGTQVVNFNYQTNVANEIRLITVDNTANQTLYTSGYYPANRLRGTLIRDEDNRASLEYLDKSGKVVCKIAALGTTDETITYYVYDIYGLLTFVIPPQAVAVIGSNWDLLNDATFRKQWLFRYKYDHRNRMIEKQVPGAEKVEMVYDKRDRLVFTLDGNRQALEELPPNTETVESGTYPVSTHTGISYVRMSGAKVVLKKPGFTASKADGFSVRKTADLSIFQNKWLYTKYDELNRPVITGIKHMVATRAELQAAIDNNSSYDFSVSYVGDTGSHLYGYDDTSYPSASGTDILTVTYYDNYNFITDLSDLGWGNSYDHSGHHTATKGQVTGRLTKLLGSSPVKMLKSANYYDDRMRPTATISENYFGGADKVVTTYLNEVSPLVSRMVTTHRKGSSTTTVTENFTYDHRDRLLTHTHAIDGNGTKTLASNSYNALGQLIEKDLDDDGTPIQSVDYRYNERGWLKTINGGSGSLSEGDKFGMELKYNNAPNPQYNGNIGQMLWRTLGGSGVTTASQDYRYTYDALNRLTGANHYGSFDVSGITYDKNGNILTLDRNSVDQLDYDYLGNQLVRVEDRTNNAQGFDDGASQTVEYEYDSNGNMIKDLNKGIAQINYNYLNLPARVVLENGHKVIYTYDAAGIKHAKVVDDGSPETTNYVGGFHYINNTLQFLQHAEGRALKSGSDWNYEYNLTDHLGNVRVTVDESGTVKQRQDYYPFGLTFNSSVSSPENLYKYNGFEEQKETGWYDYLARQYDPELGRFTSIDPAADLMRRQGPYNYAFNNPIRFIDPDGMMPEDKTKDIEVESTLTTDKIVETQRSTSSSSRVVKTGSDEYIELLGNSTITSRNGIGDEIIVNTTTTTVTTTSTEINYDETGKVIGDPESTTTTTTSTKTNVTVVDADGGTAGGFADTQTSSTTTSGGLSEFANEAIAYRGANQFSITNKNENQAQMDRQDAFINNVGRFSDWSGGTTTGVGIYTMMQGLPVVGQAVSIAGAASTFTSLLLGGSAKHARKSMKSDACQGCTKRIRR